MKTFGQKLTVLLLKGIAYLPFWVLYALSDFFFVLIFHLVGYRKKVVYQNLRNSFPEKSAEEIDKIARKYYRHFCDLFMETAKFDRLSAKELDKHIRYEHLERLNDVFDQGKGMLLICFHYNNWEWNASMIQFLKHDFLMVFSPMKNNPSMENYVTKMRTKFGALKVPMQNAPRASFSLNQGPNYGIMWLAADQTPPAASQYWTTFLNQETPFFSGPQKIALKTNVPVFFHYIHKVKRGQYVVDFFEMTPHPVQDGEHAVLLDYVDIVEKLIQLRPEFWLWSHRRWKHKRSEGQELIPRNKTNRFDKQIDEMFERLNQIKSL
ncbi:lysophospholipid acyltransferase family protein [Mangrovibacterium diazotrophicum]|uniref:KDO2-lipid IV(A) lauroyltransferase n=1 Tax=Mangrovibacterium diazotrophicum TaxID=1261403 RepID=A0A419W7G5_9BACT|nr:lysophospholipid acyltransferase family protein [Mangrovibacterium diazotrophicum]RKD91302.1 KDO2-lipid IV(A) lauroyltransferase [Mangrovibacterium diazotrophicum]